MLTLQFIPYAEIENLDSKQRINKLLKIVKEEKIVVLEGKLRSEEEAGLIQKTMEEINTTSPVILAITVMATSIVIIMWTDLI